MDTFKKLADKIGRERVIWRYDPILTNEEYNVSFHQEAFARIADELKDHTAKCMLGFIDHYQHIRNSVRLFESIRTSGKCSQRNQQTSPDADWTICLKDLENDLKTVAKEKEVVYNEFNTFNS